jgi:hypothetical protein
MGRNRKALDQELDPEEAIADGLKFVGATEKALAILADLPGPAWLRIAELTAANLRGHLSYEAWRAACGAMIERAAQP